MLLFFKKEKKEIELTKTKRKKLYKQTKQGKIEICLFFENAMSNNDIYFQNSINHKNAFSRDSLHTHTRTVLC